MFAKTTEDPTVLIVTDVDGFKTEEELRADGFLPYTPADPPAEPLDRRHYYKPEYYPQDGELLTRWIVTECEAAPRSISKFKLKLAVAQAGLLSQFTALLAQVEVAPGYMGDEAFRDAVTLDDDNPKFKAAVQLVKQQFGMTDGQIEEILSASVVE